MKHVIAVALFGAFMLASLGCGEEAKKPATTTPAPTGAAPPVVTKAPTPPGKAPARKVIEPN